MERNVVIESFSVSEHIAGIVNGLSRDLLTHSPSKSFVNRCETRLRLLLLFLVCSLFNFVSLKAHQGLIAGTYTAEFDYDVVGTLAAARYDEVDILYKLPDRIGNIYPDRFGKEATYERGGRRKEDKEWTYHFDGEGFLTQRVSKTESIERYDWIRRKLLVEPLTWTYEWDGAGQLVRVKNNKTVNLRFEYDALGRRVAKINEYGKAEGHKITRFLWDGNVPLHEWSYPLSDRPETIDDSDGRRSYASPEPQTELTTWIFDEGTFVPSAKLVGDRRYSIISDYLGTPIEAYDEEGQRVWARELDIYGRTRSEEGAVGFIPFLYQGQYLDGETGLAYNRFRYYSPETGAYISQDPIRLEAGLTNLYAYVHDVNAWIDPWGLRGALSFIGDTLHPGTITPQEPGGYITIQATGSYSGDKKAMYEKFLNSDIWSSEYRAHHVCYNPQTNEMTMQLVKAEPHTVGHIGGVKDFKDSTGFAYDTPEAQAEAAKRTKATNTH